MPIVTLGAVAAYFGRDVDRGVSKVVGIVEAAARDGIDLLVLPDACLGGYIGDFRTPDPDDPPPALDPDGPEIAAVIAAAGSMTVCVGYAEAADVQYVVSADPGCLMQLQTRADATGRSLRTRHIAEIVRDALRRPA